MKGAVFTGDRRVEVIDLPRPEPGPTEVLVEIKASGLCGSDLRHYRRSGSEMSERERTVVRGHEPCGVVTELGTCARNVQVGDRVMVHHYSGCGKCKYCLTGWPQLCGPSYVLYGSTAPGGHQDYMVCPDMACVPMPDQLSFEEGASCACGTGTAYQALKRLGPSGLDTLAVFGQGPVGLSVTLLAKAMGARVIAIDTIGERLALARQFGADAVVDAREVDPVVAVQELTDGEGAEATMDCTGVEVARVNCVKAAKLWGRVCFVGEGGTATFEMSPQIIHKHLTIYGSWTFSTHGLAEVARFIIERKLPLRETITHTFPLTEANRAYQLFDTGTTGKIALLPD